MHVSDVTLKDAPTWRQLHAARAVVLLDRGRVRSLHHRTSITAVNVVPGRPGIPGMNMYIPEFPGMEKGVREWIPYAKQMSCERANQWTRLQMKLPALPVCNQECDRMLSWKKMGATKRQWPRQIALLCCESSFLSVLMFQSWITSTAFLLAVASSLSTNYNLSSTVRLEWSLVETVKITSLHYYETNSIGSEQNSGLNSNCAY